MFQYYKQTQLEAMASEKAAAEFQLEKEAKRLQEVQVCRFNLILVLHCKYSPVIRNSWFLVNTIGSN